MTVHDPFMCEKGELELNQILAGYFHDEDRLTREAVIELDRVIHQSADFIAVAMLMQGDGTIADEHGLLSRLLLRPIGMHQPEEGDLLVVIGILERANSELNETLHPFALQVHQTLENDHGLKACIERLTLLPDRGKTIRRIRHINRIAAIKPGSHVHQNFRHTTSF